MKTILYLGSDPPHFSAEGRVIHYPVITIVPRSLDSPEIKNAFEKIAQYTHVLFTSKNGVKVFFDLFDQLHFSRDILIKKQILAIGRVTAYALSSYAIFPNYIAKEETQEGMIELLERMDLTEAFLFLPRSSLSRPKILDYLIERKISHRTCDLYDTVAQKLLPVPDLETVDEIVFTSPSTVDAFFKIYPCIPENKNAVAIGPITSEYLALRLSRNYPNLSSNQ
ncbi:MAG TPA: uroporphyrinogen-III synthase [Rhabdochlamydiaceae bacterium]|nr:uroporphyrinogen-III synthase [Rhabdochlamydiaceae bacterium]